MSAVEDFRTALMGSIRDDIPDDVFLLLRAVWEAWANAEGGIPSEIESRRWSPVCTAACKVVGIE